MRSFYERMLTRSLNKNEREQVPSLRTKNEPEQVNFLRD